MFFYFYINQNIKKRRKKEVGGKKEEGGDEQQVIIFTGPYTYHVYHKLSSTFFENLLCTKTLGTESPSFLLTVCLWTYSLTTTSNPALLNSSNRISEIWRQKIKGWIMEA